MQVGSCRDGAPSARPSPHAIAEERSALKADIKRWKADFESWYNRKPSSSDMPPEQLAKLHRFDALEAALAALKRGENVSLPAQASSAASAPAAAAPAAPALPRPDPARLQASSPSSGARLD